MDTYARVIEAITALGVFASVMLGGEASHAAEGCGLDALPVVLTAEVDEDGYIQPSCSKCPKLTVERQADASGELQGVLELEYFDDERRSFDGKIEVTAVLEDRSEHVVVIEEVWLEQGDEAMWEIAASSEWSWEAVEIVRLRFVEG